MVRASYLDGLRTLYLPITVERVRRDYLRDWIDLPTFEHAVEVAIDLEPRCSA